MCLAVPGEVVQIEMREGLRFARVRFGGVAKLICLEHVPEAGVGDFVLVHVGFALAVIDRADAERQLALLDSLGLDEPIEGVP